VLLGHETHAHMGCFDHSLPLLLKCAQPRRTLLLLRARDLLLREDIGSSVHHQNQPAGGPMFYGSQMPGLAVRTLSAQSNLDWR
jgi:hypothetical protein